MRNTTQLKGVVLARVARALRAHNRRRITDAQFDAIAAKLARRVEAINAEEESYWLAACAARAADRKAGLYPPP